MTIYSWYIHRSIAVVLKIDWSLYDCDCDMINDLVLEGYYEKKLSYKEGLRDWEIERKWQVSREWSKGVLLSGKLMKALLPLWRQSLPYMVRECSITTQ